MRSGGNAAELNGTACAASVSRWFTQLPGLLLIESDPHRRTTFATALADEAFAVTAVGHTAEIERWPAGDIVVTESRTFTEWWMKVGATHVLVLADTAGEGVAALAQGATAWVPRHCSADELLETLRQCCARVSGQR